MINSSSSRWFHAASSFPFLMLLYYVVAGHLFDADPVFGFVPSNSRSPARLWHPVQRQQQQHYHDSGLRLLPFAVESRSPPLLLSAWGLKNPFSGGDDNAQKTNNSKSGSSPSTEGVCTIQILMSDTGGGHRASANALRDALDVLYPNQFVCEIVDIFTDYGPFWPYNDYVNMYKLMAKYPITWDIFYHFGATPLGLWLNEFLITTFCFDSFTKCLDRPIGATGKRADMVISVHPLCQDLPLKILSHLDSRGTTRLASARATPFCTVVTDLGGAHPTWFNPGVDECYVPSDVLYQAARDRGLKDSQIIQYGLPVRRGFWDNVDSKSKKQPKQTLQEKRYIRESFRKDLGLEASVPTVLVVGGGDGMGGIVEISKALGQKLGNGAAIDTTSAATSTKVTSQLVIVCGNNKEAKDELEQVSNVEWGPNVKVYVQGFVNNMDEWMKASDALVTKAGPGTIAEASICGLPCMMFSFLPGQEEGNIPFVEEAGFGKYSGDSDVIAATVSSWLASPEKLQHMQEAALQAARPHSTLDIAEDLARMAFAQKAKQSEKEKILVKAR